MKSGCRIALKTVALNSKKSQKVTNAMGCMSPAMKGYWMTMREII